MSPVVAMVGGFVAAALTVYCLHELYKRYCKKNTHREQVPTDVVSTSQRDEIFYARLIPIFKPLLPELCRAGDTVSFQIIFPGVLRNNCSYDSQLQNQLLSLLSMSMKYQNDPSSNLNPYENFPIMSEFQPVAEGAQDDVPLLCKFSVKMAGLYELCIKYRNNDVRGTPFKKIFFANFIDPECTVFQSKSPAILCVTSVPNYSVIEPRDRHNNMCQILDVDLNLFSIKVTEVESTKKGQLVEPVSFSFYQDLDEWGNARPTVRLQFELFHAGVFQGTVYYKETVIQNGSFQIVSLSAEENDKFRAVLLSNPGSVYHEAQLLQVGQQASKKKKVYIYVAPQVLSIKEFFFGFIPTQIASYRVIPATRVQLLTANDKTNVSTVSISDRMQPEVQLDINTSLAHVVIAMFSFFLQQRLGGSETFENKQKFFYQELRKVVPDKDRPSSTVININRSMLIESSLKETRSFGGKDWCRKFKIKFIDEEGVDEGGLRREWLDLMCRQMFENSDTGMFRSIGNSRLVLPNSARDPAYTLRHYELAGRIVGKCLFETSAGGHFKQMVNARFGKSFLAQIIGFPPHYKFFEHDDPEFFNSKIKYLLEAKDVTDMDLTFSEEVYGNGKLLSVVELVPKGAAIVVTNENKLQYLKALAQYRLYDMMKQEIQSFIKGLNEIVPFGLLTNFDENELEILMSGHSKVSVEELRNFHVLTPSSETHCTKIVTWFWSAVENMNDAERVRLLQFVTGSSLLPHGGFQCLEPRFRITVYGTVGKLPICHSCFNEICLSNHSDYEEFVRSLKTAIMEGSEGFGFN